ncbi:MULTISPECIES: tRNA dihydrouridine(20/20a) synthase DusA [unclassified Xanthobacter]|uniref:tRNA dihydrouridine(20/20a) synthase DusA n=1 Tax=unclassified Xanthobacter TaxID=2623496 RepID=UPI002106515D|nr:MULTISPECIES: tRNA dihydrouridine(20/20a) synthase DusA [unclassified Xanthobacter]
MPLNPNSLRFSVAPMLDWTDRHCRAFHRTFSRHARLYTEMVTAPAIIHGDRNRLLGFNAPEHPVAVQLGGSDPLQLAEAARICADFGYDEINLNVGCPSDRVQGGNFGACLMREPQLVADCVASMKAATTLPVTVKCRIGVDDQDPEEALDRLADAVVNAGADALIVHARKAWLKGLSPRENRDIPPLDYDRVRRLKQRMPHVTIALNGGIPNIDAGIEATTGLDGMMLGRVAYHEPELLHQVDPRLFGTPAPMPDTYAALDAFEPYVAAHLEAGGRLSDITRHMLGLFGGKRGSRLFRRHLATESVKPGAGLQVLRDAIDHVRRRDLAAA